MANTARAVRADARGRAERGRVMEDVAEANHAFDIKAVYPRCLWGPGKFINSRWGVSCRRRWMGWIPWTKMSTSIASDRKNNYRLSLTISLTLNTLLHSHLIFCTPSNYGESVVFFST